jgi:SOS-response transcriptional repressor LexA
MSNEWISARLKSLRITKGSLAKSLGIDPARVSEIVAGRRNVQVSELPVMAEILQMSTEDLVARLTPRKVALIQEAQRAAAINPPPLPPPPQPLPTPSAAVADLPSGGLMPRNLPVYGCARGGIDGSFEMNGQGMDYVERPPSLAGARNAYAVYVQGDSMSPRFEAGWLLHVNPNRPVRRGDNVVVQIKPADEHAPPLAYIKLFEATTPTKLIATQFNPQKELEWPLEEVVSIHRVVGIAEM